jgi:anaerobic magnesium-protoporphyrin IX monomethyl ester cyclase
MMASRILLATCSLADRWISTVDSDNGHYPLGLAYLHSVLEEAGHEVETMFLNSVPHEECWRRLAERIETLKPQVLGISIISDSRVSSFRTVEHVHAHYPDIKIVLGGVHVSTMYEQIARRLPYCTLALGEAEITLRELVHTFETNGDVSTVKGIAFCQNGQIIQTEKRELIEDLDALPIPKHAAFFNEARFSAQLLTSRGCPFACTFCVLDSFSRRKVRFRSAQRVVDEIEQILREFPQVKMIQILDDQFFTDNKRVIEICEEIVRRNIQCEFHCAGRMKPITRKMIVALERAGFSTVHLGLESGSKSVLKRAKKGITPDDAIKAMELFADSSICVNILLIIGLPGESLGTIIESGQLIQRLQKIKYHLYSQRIQTIFVYPGSELYEMCKSAGALNDDFWLTDEDVPYYTLEHSFEELTLMREILLTYISPVRLITPGGLAVQKHMLSEIVGASFQQTGMRAIVNTVVQATRELTQEGAINFSMTKDWAAKMQTEGHVNLSTLTREIGTEGQFMLGFTKVPAESIIEYFVEFAYLNRVHRLTDQITVRVAEIIEKCMGQGHEAKKLMDDLGFTEWATARENRITLRL